PLARGLGSSSSALVAGGLLAYAALGLEVDPQRLLRILLPLEGHPDNLAACILGGLTVGVSGGSPDQATLRNLPLHSAFGPVIVLIPEFQVPTKLARAALPPTCKREDAAFNLQRQALLLSAFATNRVEDFAEAMRDRLHQPQRRHLVPGYDEVASLAAAGGAAVCVSGAGPTLLVVPPSADPQGIIDLAGSLATAWEACCGHTVSPHVLSVCREGGRV
ncbi:MAG: homoserine kinase, partial [Planctomycetota bacterium]